MLLKEKMLLLECSSNNNTAQLKKNSLSNKLSFGELLHHDNQTNNKLCVCSTWSSLVMNMTYCNQQITLRIAWTCTSQAEYISGNVNHLQVKLS